MANVRMHIECAVNVTWQNRKLNHLKYFHVNFFVLISKHVKRQNVTHDYVRNSTTTFLRSFFSRVHTKLHVYKSSALCDYI